MSNLARLPLPYLNIPFNSTFQASLKEYEGCYIGTKSLLQWPGSCCADWILATYLGLLHTQLPSTLHRRHEQLWGITSGTALAPVEKYDGSALILGLTLQKSGALSLGPGGSSPRSSVVGSSWSVSEPGSLDYQQQLLPSMSSCEPQVS